MKNSKETQMEAELDKLNSKFDSIIVDIKFKESKILSLEEEINTLKNNQTREKLISDAESSTNRIDEESSHRLYTQYRNIMRNYDGDKRVFITLYENVKNEEKAVLQLEKQMARINERIDNSIKSIEREKKRRDKLSTLKEKCDFYRYKYAQLYNENDKLKELLNAILYHSKTNEKKLHSLEADDLIKKFNNIIKEREKYDLEQLLVFKDINEILEEQYNIINNSKLNYD